MSNDKVHMNLISIDLDNMTSKDITPKNKGRKVSIRNNHGELTEVYADLDMGDMVECIKGTIGTCDGGSMHLLFTDSLLTAGNKYKVSHTTRWNGTLVSYVTNDDGAQTWVTTEHFKLL